MSVRRKGCIKLLGIIALCPFLMSCAAAQEAGGTDVEGLSS